MIAIRTGTSLSQGQFAINESKVDVSDAFVPFDFYDEATSLDMAGNPVSVSKFIGTFCINDLREIISDANEKINLMVK